MHCVQYNMYCTYMYMCTRMWCVVLHVHMYIILAIVFCIQLEYVRRGGQITLKLTLILCCNNIRMLGCSKSCSPMCSEFNLKLCWLHV